MVYYFVLFPRYSAVCLVLFPRFVLFCFPRYSAVCLVLFPGLSIGLSCSVSAVFRGLSCSVPRGIPRFSFFCSPALNAGFSLCIFRASLREPLRAPRCPVSAVFRGLSCSLAPQCPVSASFASGFLLRLLAPHCMRVIRSVCCAVRLRRAAPFLAVTPDLIRHLDPAWGCLPAGGSLHTSPQTSRARPSVRAYPSI